MNSSGRKRRTLHERAPLLESARLRLRAHTADDLDVVAALWADPRVVEYVMTRPATREQSWTRIVAYRGHWALLGFGVWAIEDKATGRYIGDVGLGEFQRGIDRSFDSDPEVGMVLAPEAHGRGLATEAMLLVLAWSDAAIGSRVVCMADSGNRAALRLAQRCGFIAFTETTYQGRGVLLHGREPVHSNAADTRLACNANGGCDAGA
jgi:RimJ/RimL family protein N-acetyltransferase